MNKHVLPTPYSDQTVRVVRTLRANSNNTKLLARSITTSRLCTCLLQETCRKTTPKYSDFNGQQRKYKDNTMPISGSLLALAIQTAAQIGLQEAKSEERLEGKVSWWTGRFAPHVFEFLRTISPTILSSQVKTTEEAIASLLKEKALSSTALHYSDRMSALRWKLIYNHPAFIHRADASPHGNVSVQQFKKYSSDVQRDILFLVENAQCISISREQKENYTNAIKSLEQGRTNIAIDVSIQELLESYNKLSSQERQKITPDDYIAMSSSDKCRALQLLLQYGHTLAENEKAHLLQLAHLTSPEKIDNCTPLENFKLQRSITCCFMRLDPEVQALFNQISPDDIKLLSSENQKILYLLAKAKFEKCATVSARIAFQHVQQTQYLHIAQILESLLTIEEKAVLAHAITARLGFSHLSSHEIDTFISEIDTALEMSCSAETQVLQKALDILAAYTAPAHNKTLEADLSTILDQVGPQVLSSGPLTAIISSLSLNQSYTTDEKIRLGALLQKARRGNAITAEAVLLLPYVKKVISSQFSDNGRWSSCAEATFEALCTKARSFPLLIGSKTIAGIPLSGSTSLPQKNNAKMNIMHQKCIQEYAQETGTDVTSGSFLSSLLNEPLPVDSIVDFGLADEKQPHFMQNTGATNQETTKSQYLQRLSSVGNELKEKARHKALLWAEWFAQTTIQNRAPSLLTDWVEHATALVENKAKLDAAQVAKAVLVQAYGLWGTILQSIEEKPQFFRFATTLYIKKISPHLDRLFSLLDTAYHAGAAKYSSELISMRISSSVQNKSVAGSRRSYKARAEAYKQKEFDFLLSTLPLLSNLFLHSQKFPALPAIQQAILPNLLNLIAQQSTKYSEALWYSLAMPSEAALNMLDSAIHSTAKLQQLYHLAYSENPNEYFIDPLRIENFKKLSSFEQEYVFEQTATTDHFEALKELDKICDYAVEKLPSFTPEEVSALTTAKRAHMTQIIAENNPGWDIKNDPALLSEQFCSLSMDAQSQLLQLHPQEYLEMSEPIKQDLSQFLHVHSNHANIPSEVEDFQTIELFNALPKALRAEWYTSLRFRQKLKDEIEKILKNHSEAIKLKKISIENDITGYTDNHYLPLGYEITQLQHSCRALVTEIKAKAKIIESLEQALSGIQIRSSDDKCKQVITLESEIQNHEKQLETKTEKLAEKIEKQQQVTAVVKRLQELQYDLLQEHAALLPVENSQSLEEYSLSPQSEDAIQNVISLTLSEICTDLEEELLLNLERGSALEFQKRLAFSRELLDTLITTGKEHIRSINEKIFCLRTSLQNSSAQTEREQLRHELQTLHHFSKRLSTVFVQKMISTKQSFEKQFTARKKQQESELLHAQEQLTTLAPKSHRSR